jgi:dipeptidyl aminopeptidase/acylaminoacyl peptidase
VIPGSPFARGQWGWDMETQLLAKHGYVVLRPQIRGSEGFGKKFHDAGYREWGRAMQDDITNGVNYLIREKIADPNRICIYGTGYGGYVAMWGLVGTPDLYRCAISFGGISDLSQMYDDWLKLSDDKDIKEIRSAWIGDITRDKAQFDAVSPAKHADRIKAPLLIMHGEMDRSIPVSQSKKMMGALDDNHKVYEWVSLPESGNVVRERNLYYKSVLQFLDKYNPPDPARVTSIAKDATTVPGIEKQSVTSIPTH